MENEEKKIEQTAGEPKAEVKEETTRNKPEEVTASPAGEESKAEEASQSDFPKTEAPLEQPEAQEGEDELQKSIKEANQQADSIEGEYNGSENNTLSSAYFKPIHYINDGTISIDQEIENLRQGFVKKRNPGKIFHIISLAVILVCFGAFIGLTRWKNAPTWALWSVFGVMVAVLVVTFALSYYFRKQETKVTSNYRVDFVNTVNGYTLSNLHLDNAKIAPEAKIEDKEIIEAHYFRTITSIQSRAVVVATRNQFSFSCAEVAVVIPTRSIEDANKVPVDYLNRDGTPYIENTVDAGTTTLFGTQEISSSVTRIDATIADQISGNANVKNREKDQKKAKKNEKKNTNTGFFGRYFSYGATVPSDESRIISFRGDKQFTFLPTYLNGFEARKVPGLKKNILVYVVSPVKSAKFFTKENIDILNSMPVGITVQSCFLSLNSYGRKAGFNLSDDVRQCPQKQIETLGCFDTYQHAIDTAFAFFDAIAANKD